MPEATPSIHSLPVQRSFVRAVKPWIIWWLPEAGEEVEVFMAFLAQQIPEEVGEREVSTVLEEEVEEEVEEVF